MAGKWKVSELTPTRVDTPDGSISVSWVNNFDGGVRERKAEAVARLIAAAPDLLEALQDAEASLATLFESGDFGMEDRAIELGMDALADIRASLASATQPLPPPNEDQP